VKTMKVIKSRLLLSVRARIAPTGSENDENKEIGQPKVV